ncbi:MAG: hypothetical protein FWC75_08700 [Oscillospiraceae bacterium]|nr:hypothetical protein [Oscillospiraceae bacterium]
MKVKKLIILVLVLSMVFALAGVSYAHSTVICDENIVSSDHPAPRGMPCNCGGIMFQIRVPCSCGQIIIVWRCSSCGAGW